jgi:hypothetical protein
VLLFSFERPRFFEVCYGTRLHALISDGFDTFNECHEEVVNRSSAGERMGL